MSFVTSRRDHVPVGHGEAVVLPGGVTIPSRKPGDRHSFCQPLVVAKRRQGRPGPDDRRHRSGPAPKARNRLGALRLIMNGAAALLRSLVNSDVTVCFANPGTSEMHFVAGLDEVPEMRAVLTLFEGVATGAADGYGRMAGRPAATLLHLGPGLGNGLANLHNARRASTPLVNIVGDHASYHKRFDAPLESDIDATAATVSGWLRRTESTDRLGDDAAEAVAAARRPPGQIATVILPADVSWSDGGRPGTPCPVAIPSPVAGGAVEGAARALQSGAPVALLLGGQGTTEPALRAAGRVAEVSGATLICETFPARIARGSGLPPVSRLPYFAESALSELSAFAHLVLVGARSPVSFFAYPGRPSVLVPESCQVHVLSTAGEDAAAALEDLADVLGAGPAGSFATPPLPSRPSGPVNAVSVAAALAATLPGGAIVVDEANTSGLHLPAATAGAPPHDWLTLTGGAIGFGLPVAIGAAVACPERPVLSLQADGSAMYTISALWTQAREGLDVTTVVLNNRSYAILNMELQRVGAAASGARARRLLDLSEPDLDFVALAGGMGVPAVRPETAEELTFAIERALAEPGPHLIDAVLRPPRD